MTSNDHISPIKCALKFKPSLLVIFYKDLNTGKTRRRTIPLRGFSKTNDVRGYGDKLINNPRHADYVSKLPRQQLDSLLQRIKDAHNGVTPSPDHTPTPSPNHTSLLGMPSLTSPSRQNDSKLLNEDFDAALAELLGTGDDVDENIMDVTLEDKSIGNPPLTSLSSFNKPSPMGKLPPISKLPPLNANYSMLTTKDVIDKPSISEKTTLLNPSPQVSLNIASTTAQPNVSVSEERHEELEVPDYSADFNSESEKTESVQNVKQVIDDDKSLSFAIEELEDDDSLCLSEEDNEGDNFAGDLLCSFSGEDFRAMNIVTPPPQDVPLTNGHSTHHTNEEDLNKVDDVYLANKKAEMDTMFRVNQLKPGDAGYVYDKEVQFEGANIESGWDSDNDSYSDF